MEELVEACAQAAWAAVARCERRMGMEERTPWTWLEAPEDRREAMRAAVRKVLAKEEDDSGGGGSAAGAMVHELVREVVLTVAEAEHARNEARMALQGRESASDVANRALRELGLLRTELRPELEALDRRLKGITDTQLLSSALVLRDIIGKLIRIQT